MPVKSSLFLPLTALGLCFMIGMVGSSMVVTRAIYKIKRADTSIEVKGYAERKVQSDYGKIWFTLSARAEGSKEAHQILKDNTEKLMTFLKNKGFEFEHMKADSIDQRKFFKITASGQQTNDIEGYEVSQRFLYGLGDVKKISETALHLSEFTAEGYDLQINEPVYVYSSEKLEALKLEMIGDATINARQRAEKFVTQSGMSVGPLKSARQGIFQVSSQDDTNSGDYNTYDTRSIEKIIKVVVTLNYNTN